MYRNTTDSCVLISYSETSLNSFFSVNSVFLKLLEFSVYNMSSANSDSFTYSSLFGGPLFLFLV